MEERNSRGTAGSDQGDGFKQAEEYKGSDSASDPNGGASPGSGQYDPAGQRPLPVYRPEQDYPGGSASNPSVRPANGYGAPQGGPSDPAHRANPGHGLGQDEAPGSGRRSANQGGLPAGFNQGHGGQGNGHSSSGSISAMAVSGLVLGIVALILSFIPIINNLAFFIGILGLIFALVGMHATGRRARKKGRGLSIAGVIICVLALVVTLAMQKGFSKAGESFRTPEKQTTTSQSTGTVKDAPKEGEKAKTKTITLKASSTGSGSATYGPAGSSSQEKFEGSWQKDITGEAAKQMHSLTVMGDFMNQDPNQKLTCDILVDGVSKDHKEATGAGAVVTCTSPIF